MFILGSWIFASLFVEAGKWVFEFKFKKKEGRKVND